VNKTCYARWGLLLAAAASACPPAAASGALPCRPAGGSPTALAALAADIRSGDSFYRYLAASKGAPSMCRGKAGAAGDAPGQAAESWLAFSWPDGSRFEKTHLSPEISVMRYGRAGGLPDAGEAAAQLRAYADKRGLHIDWTTPYHLHEDGARIVEYRDKDPGVNGIARLTYARHTLVAVSLSVAP